MPAVLDDLETQVKNTVDAEGAAVVLMNGFADRVTAAVNAAMANGATAAQLAPVTDEVNALKASSAALSAAVVANTPAANVGKGRP
jgi:ABC-type branched-subunit amino acid transport system substrate-binding protein